MDAINAITPKSERSPLVGSNDEFKSVADGFAALLQITGKKGAMDSGASEAESELMRLDDGRDLVRDSHTLNDTDARNDDLDDDSQVEDPNSDDTARNADDDGESSENDGETADASEGEESDTSEQGAESENEAATNGENAGQPQVAGDGATADLGVIQGAAAAAAAAAQVKTTTESASTQTAAAQTGQILATADKNAGQTGVQTQQAAQSGEQKVVANTGEQANKSFVPVETQSAQASAAGAQAQTAATQQTTAQANKAQAQQGQQVTQERVQGQNPEVRSAAAQAQSQDLSQRLGKDARANVQVNVTGQQAAQGQTEASQFNRFVGYNGGESRTVSTANGQAGAGTASNAAIANTDTPAERPATQTTAPIPSSASQPHTQATQPGAPTTATARADLAGTAARGDAGLTQSGSGQSNAASTAAPQPTAQAGAAQSSQSFAQSVQQPSGAERAPAPTSSQVIDQIKVNINKSVKAGMDRVTIHLRPDNLGKIEVKMELSQDGKVRAFVNVENKDTLDLLQRDARGLEKALQDAGLRTDSNNLHFALKSDQNGQDGKGENNGNANAANDNADADTNELEIEDEQYERSTAAAARGGVDQMV